jgi:hypothetical protein
MAQKVTSQAPAQAAGGLAATKGGPTAPFGPAAGGPTAPPDQPNGRPWQQGYAASDAEVLAGEKSQAPTKVG